MQDARDLERRVAELEAELTRVRKAQFRGIRKQASWDLFGMPAWCIALGPDPETGQLKGHARGFLAIGDMATGFLAIGGLARGVLAFGGLALGCVSFGGCSIGLAVALGGFAMGGVAFGGAAVGGVAVGGGAVGVYAMGGAVAGTHVIRQDRQDPEAVAFFGRYGIHPPPSRRGR
ncbi:MAG TPA: hypothetical protein VJ570_01015 [Holophagaceae bacterium]|nr:hypothetical protein [Holophagaceae bacterium]